MKLEIFWTDFRKMLKYQIMKIQTVVSEFFRSDG